MSRKMTKKERECLVKCIEKSRQCVEKEGKSKESCDVDYSKCLAQCEFVTI